MRGTAPDAPAHLDSQDDRRAQPKPPRPPQPLRHGQRLLGLGLHALGLFPLIRWIVLGYSAGLSANPQEFLTRSSGTWALVLLWATLSITPLRRIGGWNTLVRQRRKLGLYAFFYTVLHVIAWGLWDRGGVPRAMWADLWQRDFIGIGAVATLCLIPLALTSTHGWMRRLGPWWGRLHALIYPAAILSVWHFFWMRAGKNDYFEPRLYAVTLALLLGLRLWWWTSRRFRRAPGRTARGSGGLG
ncbi:sulfite oxidase heme-binding subunit YedZ [Castellaniella caeni]|uniref:sulfite oxidase heme-binding subunit YedZ n=1 Tax=Castellaniella caeni TaxID=266123 RepID=UPI000A060D95|nr:protein-methionine-sulfoxide reductase heme-binding subunit MsrQ [Castellaniella caeni]